MWQRTVLGWAAAFNKNKLPVWRWAVLVLLAITAHTSWAQDYCPAGQTCYPATRGFMGPGVYIYSGYNDAIEERLLFSSAAAVCSSRNYQEPDFKVVCTGGALCDCQSYWRDTDSTWHELVHVVSEEIPFAWCTYRSDGIKQPGYVYGAGGDGNGNMWCTSNGDRAVISISGASGTKALPAGPALAQKAILTRSGARLPYEFVKISLAGQGEIYGQTNAQGEFPFTYVPPYKKAVETITASCDLCGNTAQKSFVVEPCDACEGKRGNPINAATGEKEQSEADWTDAALHPLSLVRHYRSYGTTDARLGPGWSHNWSAAAQSSDTQASIRFGDGTKVVFNRESRQTPWIADNRRDTLMDTATGVTYLRASDESRWTFSASGKLQSVAQRNGWTATLAYDLEARLSTVTNAFGRTLRFSYDAQAQRLTAVTLPDGQVVRYFYDASARLSGTRYADNASRAYVYEDARWPFALTGIIDESATRYATFAYDDMGRGISTQHAGNAQPYGLTYATTASTGRLVAYETPPASTYRVTSQVRDPMGTLRTYTWQGG